ncbi:MAG: S8 family serine peptidase [Bacteroidota bacterium]
MLKNYTAALVILLLCSTGLIRAAEEKYGILLNSATISPKENLQEYIQSPAITEAELVSGVYFRYVQFREIPSTEEKEKMKSAGMELLDYLPNYTFVAAFVKDFDLNQLSAWNIRSVLHIAPTFKLSMQLANNSIPGEAKVEDGKLLVNIVYYAILDDSEVLLAVEKIYDVVHQDLIANVITAKVPQEQILAFAGNHFIASIEPVNPSEKEDLLNRSLHRSNVISSDWSGGRQYNGQGVSVMLQDDGMIGPHIDYTGRLVHYISTNSGNHGDHCGGIIMAAGNLDPTAKGMGWGATIYVYGASPSYPGFDSIYNHYVLHGIVITSTSYSNGCNAGYTSLAQELDMQTLQMNSLIHVFSAGNSGTSDCGYGAGAGWANVTGGHKVGKNVIAVGNLDYTDALNTSSSRGPAHDGRLKPEVCGMGTNVYSTMDPNDYQFLTGTSMSCPGVSGTFSQLYQAYRSLNGNQNPRSDLMKAIMMNSADDLGNPGPDYRFGYGRINALKGVKYIEQNRFMFGSVSQGNTNNHTITVPSGTSQVKIMVYWHDYQAAVNASVALVNNLNMQVIDPTSATFNPWILDYTPNPTNLNANAVRGINIRDNHEQVTIDNPVAGTYTITINGAVVPQGPQNYVIVYEFIDNSVTVIYPMGGEGLVPGSQESIRWDAHGNTGTFNVEYSTNNGSTWNTINASVAGTQRYVNWTPPAVVTGQALVRVTRNTQSDVSDANFSIIGVPQNIQVSWACPDSLLLTWNAVTGATGYEIYKLGNMYMDSIGTSATTSFVVTNVPSTGTYWFSVRALGPQNCEGRRAIAIQKTPGVFNCPIAIDASVSNVNQPSGTLNTCMNPSGTPVTILLTNPGSTAISNIPVHYKINNGTPVNETYTGSLAPMASALYTFTALANLGTPGNYTITAWSTYTNDGNLYNDTSLTGVTVVNGTAVNLPWSEDFESFTLCATTTNCGTTNCTMANGLRNEPNNTYDDIDWRTSQGSTPSANTGPDLDAVPGTSTGNYVYTEASACFGYEAKLLTPCISLAGTQNPVFTFRYHMFGADMGTLHVDVLAGGVWNNDVIPAVSGNQGTGWLTGTVPLNAYIGQTVVVRFRGITGVDYTSDMALDGFSVSDIVGMNQEMLAANVSLYPNPSNGLFNLNVNNIAAGNVKISVKDMLGREVYSADMGNGPVISSQIDLSACADGIYNLTVTIGENQYTVKLSNIK